MLEDINKKHEAMASTYVSSQRHTLQVHTVSFSILIIKRSNISSNHVTSSVKSRCQLSHLIYFIGCFTVVLSVF